MTKKEVLDLYRDSLSYLAKEINKNFTVLQNIANTLELDKEQRYELLMRRNGSEVFSSYLEYESDNWHTYYYSDDYLVRTELPNKNVEYIIERMIPEDIENLASDDNVIEILDPKREILSIHTLPSGRENKYGPDEIVTNNYSWA